MIVPISSVRKMIKDVDCSRSGSSAVFSIVEVYKEDNELTIGKSGPSVKLRVL